MQATDRPSFVEALWDFEPDGQLTAVKMRRGDVMQVVCDDNGSGWLTVHHTQTPRGSRTQGIVPTSFCKMVAQPDGVRLVAMASGVPERPSPAPMPPHATLWTYIGAVGAGAVGGAMIVGVTIGAPGENSLLAPCDLPAARRDLLIC